jgi:dihydroneopterin aldolase
MQIKRSSIELSGFKFFAHHGCFDFEREQGNDFEVDLVVNLSSIEESAKSDSLEHTLNYAILYNIIREEMEKPRNLLESVAYSIAERVSKCEKVDSGVVKISKYNPPFDYGNHDSANCKSTVVIEF